jgi:hypothetical protein
MANLQQPQSLKIPVRVARPDIWAYCQPKLTKIWLADLPSASHINVAEQVLERLRQLNHLEGEAEGRFEILEVMRPTICRLLDDLRKPSVRTSFPLNESNSRLSKLISSITTELAIGYWIVSQAILSDSATWRLQKKSATVAQRTLASLGQTLLFTYLFKAIEPKGIWLDIHHLYLEFQKVKNDKVFDKSGRTLSKTSIIDGYKQLLLLRLAEPYSLLHSEVIEVYRSLEKWADIVSLETLDKSQNLSLPYCLVDYQKDSPAYWVQEQSQLAANLGYLNRIALLRLLNDHKEFVDVGVGRYDAASLTGAQLPLSLDLIKYLEQRWSGKEQSVAKVFGNREPRLFVLGIKSIHQHLNEIRHPDELTQNELFAEAHSDSKLTCERLEPESITLGQPIAFRKREGSKHKLALGMTSSILNQRDGSVEFQLHLLSGNPQAAGIQPIKANTTNAPQSYQRVILFFVKEAVGRKTWIMVESRHIKQGDQLRLLTNREAAIVGILRRVNIGNHCYLLECKVLKKARE